MKCLNNCIFMRCSEIRTDLPCHCFISKKEVNLGETCPYENKTITELNIEANYEEMRDVKREELDRVFKMSIYEIAEAFEYYKERIEKLERSQKND